MSARHALPRPKVRVGDPVGLFLGCLWALGTAAGFTCLGVLVGDTTSGPELAELVPTTPDSAHQTA